MTDLSERERSDLALRFQAAVLERVNDAVIAVDSEERITYFNAAAERLYGVSAERALGVSLREIVGYRFSDPQAEKAAYEALAQSGFWRGENIHVRRDGTSLHVESAVSVLKSEEGQGFGMLAVIRDVTGRKRAEVRAGFLRIIADRLRDLTDPRAIMAAAAESLGRHMHVGRCGYGEVDDAGEFVTVERDWTNGTMPSAVGHHRLDDDGPEFAAEVRAGRTARVDGTLADVRMEGAAAAAHVALGGTRASLTVPLIKGGRFAALLYVHQAAPRPWTDEDEAIVRDVAERTWEAVERARGEDRLRESDRRFRLMADAAPVLVWIADTTKACIWFNRPWLEFTGRSMQQETGYGWAEGVHPEDLGRCVSIYNQNFDNRQPFSMEYRLRRHDGEYRWVLDNGIPLYEGPGGAFSGYIASCIDITDRKRAEEDLRRLAAVAEQSSDFIGIATLEGRGLFLNPAGRRMTGVPAEADIADYIIADFFAPEDRAFVDTVVVPALFIEDGRWEGELRFRHLATGNLIPVLYKAFVVRDDQGAAVSVATITRDITGQKRAEEALLQADRRKDEFLATLAHELRNPLAPIRQAVRIARSANATEAQRRWSHEVIERQANHMSRLLDDLLDAARITEGKLELRKELVELAAVIDTAVETARPLIDARRHHLTVSLPQKAVHLHADALRLAQVIANLVTNAAKYSEPEGRIDLSASPDGDGVIISVRDSGIGIEPSMLPRVFDMFSQATGALARSDGGLGIGLALVKGLVELHGGRVEARSAGLGCGSEFIVRLPRCPVAPVPAADESEPVPSRSAGASLKIVVADDSRDSVDSLKLLLDLDGHDVHAAHDGEEAFEVAASVQPQVVLLDIGMPKLNGYEVARRIRAQPWGAHVKLIALTGWGQSQDRKRAADAGFDHHLTKPVDHDAVLSLLQQLQR
jgi:PAS domain S-box-containing protein